ncbi:hypothetical protein [uncultured Jannaschia sp.]|uniref:hypothetical protein n=1 Tax=uncultured Jannaschia sp. TaxID=293347 RepID=UPI00262DF46B|nr:hypothetical protein [uncultured Jannaschia sp.]
MFQPFVGEADHAALTARALRGNRAAVARLTALALDEAKGAAGALFGGVVEPFCHGFTQAGAPATKRWRR